MVLKNATVFVDGAFQNVDLKIEGGIFTDIQNRTEEKSFETADEVIDYEGKLILPGCIDIHSHGCIGYDFIHASVDEIEKMCEFYASNGITSILATTMTIDTETHKQAMTNIKTSMESGTKGSKILGINMEGPFLGVDKRGAHDPNYLTPIDTAVFDELYEASGKNIRIVDIDPTLPGALEFIEKYHDDITISLAHTSTNYDTAMKAFDSGASHVTHLFNAMNGLHHREPGLIGAFSDSHAHAELICDGIHVHPSVIRLIYKANSERLILISDSMCAAGLADGVYELGGQKVNVKDMRATLVDGTIAGSTVNVFEAMRRAIKFNVPVEQAILSATLLPAKAVKKDGEIGSISIGKKADFVVTDLDYNIETVYIDGKKL